MNALKNQVTLVGNIGKEIDFRTIGEKSSLAQFSLATNESYKNNKGELVQNTDWHNVKAWGKTAEIMRDVLAKGDEVMVRGKISYRNYEDKDGAKRYITEIIVQEFLKITKTKAA